MKMDSPMGFTELLPLIEKRKLPVGLKHPTRKHGSSGFFDDFVPKSLKNGNALHKMLTASPQISWMGQFLRDFLPIFQDFEA